MSSRSPLFPYDYSQRLKILYDYTFAWLPFDSICTLSELLILLQKPSVESSTNLSYYFISYTIIYGQLNSPIDQAKKSPKLRLTASPTTFYSVHKRSGPTGRCYMNTGSIIPPSSIIRTFSPWLQRLCQNEIYLQPIRPSLRVPMMALESPKLAVTMSLFVRTERRTVVPLKVEASRDLIDFSAALNSFLSSFLRLYGLLIYIDFYQNKNLSMLQKVFDASSAIFQPSFP